jgi:Antitoxin VbhA
MSSPQHPVRLNRACYQPICLGLPKLHGGNIEVVTSKEQAVADALGSLRAEGLEPEPAVVVLMERWGRGEITDKEFSAAQKVIATHGTLAPPADIAI